jgi:hypothetical protein
LENPTLVALIEDLCGRIGWREKGAGMGGETQDSGQESLVAGHLAGRPNERLVAKVQAVKTADRDHMVLGGAGGGESSKNPHVGVC